jgi:hypothetical protein
MVEGLDGNIGQYIGGVPPGWGLGARLTTLLCKKNCHEIQRIEKQMV